MMPNLLRRIRSTAILTAFAAVAATSACVADTDDAGTVDELENPGGKADSLFRDGPLMLTAAFDGSKRFGMWVDSMRFARDIERTYGKSLGITYFINTCYFDHTTVGSDIGRSANRAEDLVRTALAQQVINEGHEIGSHAVLHEDGGSWSYERWRQEFDNFHRVTDRALFNPIYEADGTPVFPKWRPMPAASAGEMGSACSTDSDCDSGICLPVAAHASFCSARCNRYNPCENGTVCGAPDWNESTDRCVPMPEFPVDYQGQELFDADGNANLNHPALERYDIIGFRAPLLAHNKALFDVMEDFGYRYDTSKILSPGPPARVVHSGQVYDSLYEFALMKNPGSRTIPMDYNYKVNTDGTPERMLEDYKRSIRDAYNVRERQPWNIGHHFSQWYNGGYWRTMQAAFEYAAQGCPEGGQLMCENVEFPTFKQLTMRLDAKADGLEDPFVDPDAIGEPTPDGDHEHGVDGEEN
ncbi:MAG: hypothetical protein JRI23_04625 [Deltaproteobacteria bacterium]|jgi:peptidoglycan/xylan/chitin deacetylase (PgdA/CDA1 family)|nr:hypothetical protein [Deltaproteobacteria bacterium]MBW2530833.1 hypothetical protein [Deltaproteobacteria bacterium]